jgi:zinc transport system substrate-binding protein
VLDFIIDLLNAYQIDGIIIMWKCFAALFGSLYATLLFATPRVVVTLKPLYALTAGVMEGVASPHQLLPDEASPHTFQLKPSSLQQLQQADLIIWVGPSLEMFLKKSLTSFPSTKIITLETLPEIKKLPQRQGREWAHHDHEDHHHDHHHGAWDPHIWLSTDNAKVIALHLAKILSERDPLHAKQYDANATKLIQKITHLKKELTELLAPVHTKPFLVYHDGYQYFEKEFDLNAIGTMNTRPDLPLSAHGLKQIKQLIQTHHIQCVFSETEFRNALITQSLAGLDIRVSELDPLGVRIPEGADAYEKIMWQLGKSIESCLNPKS